MRALDKVLTGNHLAGCTMHTGSKWCTCHGVNAYRELIELDAENEKLKHKGYELTQKLAHAQVENEELKEESDEFDKLYKRVIDEKCPSDELHCTCVPILRMEIDRLNKIVEEADEAMQTTSMPFGYNVGCQPELIKAWLKKHGGRE